MQAGGGAACACSPTLVGRTPAPGAVRGLKRPSPRSEQDLRARTWLKTLSRFSFVYSQAPATRRKPRSHRGVDPQSSVTLSVCAVTSPLALNRHVNSLMNVKVVPRARSCHEEVIDETKFIRGNIRIGDEVIASRPWYVFPVVRPIPLTLTLLKCVAICRPPLAS